MTPLAGKRIVITRPVHKAGDFAEQLQNLGAEPILLPLIQIEPLPDQTDLQRAFGGTYDWLILTSHNTVEHIRPYLADLTPFPQIGVVGTATAHALAELGLLPTLIAPVHTAKGLFQALQAQTDLRGARILLPQGDLARSTLAENLHQAGAQVTAVVAYQNSCPPIDSQLLVKPFDAITFTSTSTVQNFVSLFNDPLGVIGSAWVVCIGSVTAQAAQEIGLPVHGIAHPHTLVGMIDTLKHLFERTASL